MNKKNNVKQNKTEQKPLLDEYLLEISAEPFDRTPDTCIEMINAYGTYEIQPTADNENDFPAIAQGTPKEWKQRPLKFFRNGDDINPASDHTNGDSI
ncbi:MAG: hypothetical protein E7539_07340 [Ruminococcaceae bacterium]|nr:hypothetical protein [Oscillospiraceae bacterium]